MSSTPGRGRAGGWDAFTADPRRSSNAALRASDMDRDVASELLASAYAEGRLEADEYDERLGRAMGAKKLGDFHSLLADLVPAEPLSTRLVRRVEPVAKQQVAQLTPRVGRAVAGMSLYGWLGLAALFNAIYFLTVLAGGLVFSYYWPIWPMLGTGIPAALGYLAGRRMESGQDRRQLGR